MLNAIKYRLTNLFYNVGLFYIIEIASGVVLTILLNAVSNETGHVGGFEMASFIYLFVLGLNSFREAFFVFMQNGTHRKYLVTGYAICMGIIALGMSIFEYLGFALLSTVLPFDTAYHQMFSTFTPDHFILAALANILWVAAVYFMIAMIGFFITLLYYRMNKLAKIVVSVGVPVIGLNVLPYLDYLLFDGAVMEGLITFFTFAFGLGRYHRPFNGIISSLVIASAFIGISFLMTKRVVVKGNRIA